MIRPSLFALLAVAVLAFCIPSAPAHAHGSSYRGPSGGVPPGMRGPQPPPPDDGTIWITARRTWQGWWSLNKEVYLYPEAMAALSGPVTTVDREELPAVFAALTIALNDKMSCPERSRVALATGCLAAGAGRLPTAPRDRLIELMRDREQQTIVQTSCAFALGLSRSRDPAVLSAVTDTMLNQDAPDEVRGGAALAPAFLRPPPDAPEYRRWVVSLERATRYEGIPQLGDCAHLAMGISGEPEFLPALKTALRSGKVRRVRPVVVALGKMAERLPAVPASEVVPRLGRMMGTDNSTLKQVLVTAIGQWAGRPGTPAETAAPVVDQLLAATSGSDLKAADLAWIALARIGAVTGDRPIRDRIRAALTDAVTAMERKHSSLAAVALGILGHGGTLTREERTAITATLLGELDLVSKPAPKPAQATLSNTAPPGAPAETPTTPSTPPPPPSSPTPPASAPTPPKEKKTKLIPDPAFRGALAIGLALSGDRECLPAVWSVLKDTSADPQARGFCAVAIALLGDAALPDHLSSALPTCKDGNLLVLGSIAGGLLADRQLQPHLAPLLEGAQPTALSKSLVVRALGKTGDPRAMPALVKVVGSKGAGGLRSAAAVALADLFDRDGALIMTRLTRNLRGGLGLRALQLILKAI